MTTADIYRAFLAAGWRVDADGALTNTPPGKAYCIGDGHWVWARAMQPNTGLCRTCHGVAQHLRYLRRSA